MGLVRSLYVEPEVPVTLEPILSNDMAPAEELTCHETKEKISGFEESNKTSRHTRYV